MSFTWITEELAIGGCFDCGDVDAMAREHRIAAVVDLRSEACDDEALLRQHGIAFLHLPTDDHHAVTAEMLADGVRFVTGHLAAGRRALVHCQHGIGRSALLGLCILVARGLAPLDALERAKSRRALVSPSPAQYEAWASWLRAWSAPVPTFDEFAAIAYRHLRSA